MGSMKSLGIMSYTTEEKVYTYYGIDNSGMVSTSVARGTVQGDTWVYADEFKMGGKLVKSRYTLKHSSPNSYTFKWDVQGEGGAWTPVMEGTTTRAK
jgi:hypothetical protein